MRWNGRGQFYLGIDVGATKTHALVANHEGEALGFGAAGGGNPEGVGYEGLKSVVAAAAAEALGQAGLTAGDVGGAGFGVAGYDWPSELEPTRAAIDVLGLKAPLAIENDTLIGLMAGAQSGWGIAVVAGTGCNCRGWDEERQRRGQVTGHSLRAGEAAGSGELVQRALQMVAWAWTRRGPETALTEAFVRATGTRDAADLLQEVFTRRLDLGAWAAPLVFEAAAAGDAVAADVIRWAGCELGEMVNAVARQLRFEALEFEVVMVGGLFRGGAPLIEPLKATVRAVTPRAQFVRLEAPPVVGAVLLGMEAGGQKPSGAVRRRLEATVALSVEPVQEP
jgi:N-acetylglucosamine kinase-like BadF-type ATPase